MLNGSSSQTVRCLKWVLLFRKQLCGPGETIQSYNHQTYHKPQLIHKLSNNHLGGHEDGDIDVGKVGDEVVKLEGNITKQIQRRAVMVVGECNVMKIMIRLHSLNGSAPRHNFVTCNFAASCECRVGRVFAARGNF